MTAGKAAASATILSFNPGNVIPLVTWVLMYDI